MKRKSTIPLLLAAALWAAALPVPALTDSANGPPPEAVRQFDAGKYLLAATELETALAKDPRNARVAYWLARCYYEMRDVDKTLEYAERAVLLDPNNSEYQLLLGHATGRKADRERSLGAARRTKRAFEEAVRANPRNIAARRALLDYLSSAPWIAGGSNSDARKQAEAIAALDPIQGHLAWADYWMNDKKPERVEEELKKVLAANADADALAEAASFYERLSKAEGVEASVAAGARVKPNDTRWDYYRGVALVLQGVQPADAEKLLRGYLARQHQRSGYPSHVAVHLWLGRLYEQTQQCAKAVEEYRTVLQLDSSNHQAKDGWKRAREKCPS